MFYRVFDIVLSISNLIFPIANILEKVVFYNKHEQKNANGHLVIHMLSMSTPLYSLSPEQKYFSLKCSKSIIVTSLNHSYPQ